MAKYSHLFRIISFFVVITSVLCSCGNNTKQKDAKEREGILKELTSYQERLPYTVPGTKFTITDISVENDIVVYTCSVFNEDWDAMSMSSDFVSSDRNMARVISGMSSDAVNKFIKHGIGLKYIYTSKETGEKLLEIEMSSEKLKEVRDKVESGEIEAYTILELAQMEIAKMEIPSQVDEGVWITDAYIDGHNVYFIATIEAELDSSNLSSSDKEEMKGSLIDGLKEEWLITRHRKEMIKEDFHFIYIYKDNRGIEFARFDISPYDI